MTPLSVAVEILDMICLFPSIGNFLSGLTLET